MSQADQRIMRIRLPVPMIKELDAAILAGIGGYETRGEFIVDAIRERLLELSFGESVDAGVPERLALANAGNAAELTAQPPTTAKISATALTPPHSGPIVNDESNLSRPGGQPLFGLHNRDYPSLWVLAQLAETTCDGPVPVADFVADVLNKAWSFGELLRTIERDCGLKCTALFPTNREKRKAAEVRFRSFAIGDYHADAGTYATNGPLFEWHLAALTADQNSAPLIGVTSEGWKVLRAITDLSVQEPHPRTIATEFLGHLAEHAPADRRGFSEIVRAIGADGASRQDLLGHVAEVWGSWTENEVSTNTAGYIARAREWGLVEPKQIKGEYRLTPFGYEHATGENP